MKKIVIILSVLLLVGCGNKVSDKMPSDAFIDMKLEDIEVFQEMYVTDLVRDTNVKIEDYKLDTDTIGEKDIEFYYTYKGKKYVYETTIQVVDTVDPKIFGSSSKTVKVVNPWNLLMKYIQQQDIVMKLFIYMKQKVYLKLKIPLKEMKMNL